MTSRPFDAGAWFPINNAVFDVIMPSLSANGWRVLCVAIRQTWGWRDPNDLTGRVRKEWDTISYSQFLAKAGIGSKSTVAKALEECIERGYLLRRPAGTVAGTGATMYAYSLNRDFELEQKTITAEAEAGTEIGQARPGTETVPAPGTETVPVPVQKLYTQNRQINTRVGGGDQRTDITDKDTDERAKAIAALAEFGYNGAERALKQRSPADILAALEYAQRNKLGAGWLNVWLKSSDPAPGAGHAEAIDDDAEDRHKYLAGVCDKCWQRPCACAEEVAA